MGPLSTLDRPFFLSWQKSSSEFGSWRNSVRLITDQDICRVGVFGTSPRYLSELKSQGIVPRMPFQVRQGVGSTVILTRYNLQGNLLIYGNYALSLQLVLFSLQKFMTGFTQQGFPLKLN